MILVCGGAGYIGSHMCKLLREKQINHLVFDNLERGHKDAIQASPFVQGDLRNPADIDQVFKNHKIDLVMHFAAYIEVGESTKDPSIFWQNNVLAVHNLLEAMRTNQVGKFVFSSTAAVYGEPVQIPIQEGDQKEPTNPYGATKLTVERMLQSYDSAYDLKSVCLRYFNACGCDPDGILGEDHRPETHLIPRILLAARGDSGFKVFGTDYPTPDGTCIRDYVHVCDLAEAHLLAIQHLQAGGSSDQFNLGSGSGYSVKEVLTAAERVVGQSIPVEYADRREGDPAKLVASSDKIRSKLGWTPKFTNLEEIIGHQWSWMQANPVGYKD